MTASVPIGSAQAPHAWLAQLQPVGDARTDILLAASPGADGLR